MAIHVGFRSAAKKSHKAITVALWVAICAHVIAWFYWHPVNRVSAPELPDWVNIRLVAGIEQHAEAKPQIKPKPKPISKPKPVPVKKKIVKQKPIEKPQDKVIEQTQPEIIEEETDTASASTFIEADSKPFALENPKPVYPSSARRRGMQGVVLLQVNVSIEGKVTAIHVMRSSGFRVLDVAATNSVKHWRFMPARKGDTEVASTVQIPIRFILNNS